MPTDEHDQELKDVTPPVRVALVDGGPAGDGRAAAAAPSWPRGTVRALLDTNHVTPATRAALCARLAEGEAGAAGAEPRCLAPALYAVLRAACGRLVPQPGRGAPGEDAAVDVAAMIDTRLADGAGDGWRYAVLPPDAEAYRRGLAALDAHARSALGAPFVGLDGDAQDAALAAAQRGAVGDGAWAGEPARRFFEELLAEACECYYSHPLAQEEIGYVGMADLPGWDPIGLGVLASREPRPLSRPPARSPALPARPPARSAGAAGGAHV